MAFDIMSLVAAAAQIGYRRWGVKGALLLGGGVGGAYYLWKRRRDRGAGGTSGTEVTSG